MNNENMDKIFIELGLNRTGPGPGDVPRRVIAIYEFYADDENSYRIEISRNIGSEERPYESHVYIREEVGRAWEKCRHRPAVDCMDSAEQALFATLSFMQDHGIFKRNPS